MEACTELQVFAENIEQSWNSAESNQLELFWSALNDTTTHWTRVATTSLTTKRNYWFMKTGITWEQSLFFWCKLMKEEQSRSKSVLKTRPWFRIFSKTEEQPCSTDHLQRYIKNHGLADIPVVSIQVPITLSTHHDGF